MSFLSVGFYPETVDPYDDPVPVKGELAVEAVSISVDGELVFELKDTGRIMAKYKMGDGKTPWQALPYLGELVLQESLEFVGRNEVMAINAKAKGALAKAEQAVMRATEATAAAQAALVKAGEAEALARQNRRLLTTNTTFYVRKTGSDANDGSSEAKAFFTIGRALQELLRIDGGGFVVTIDIGAGDWAGFTLGNYSIPGSPRLVLNGQGAGTVIRGIYFDSVVSVVTLQNVKISNPAGDGILAGRCSFLTFHNITYGDCGGGMLRLLANKVYLTGRHEIIGSAAYFINSYHFGYAETVGAVVNVRGDLRFSQGFAHSSSRGSLEFGSPVNLLDGATVTGKRYSVSTGGMIMSGGGGANKFPGTIAGTNDGTGLYL